IAAKLDAAVGKKDIVENYPDLLPKIVKGKAGLGLPFRSNLFTDPTTQREFPVMTVGAPIRDSEGKVIAALALRLDPRRDFTRRPGSAGSELPARLMPSIVMVAC